MKTRQLFGVALAMPSGVVAVAMLVAGLTALITRQGIDEMVDIVLESAKVVLDKLKKT